MFKETKNPYDFKFIITGIDGPGIETVYLPEIPSEDKILFKEEQKFVRTKMSSEVEKWSDEWNAEMVSNPKYVHPHAEEIIAFEDQEFERKENGIFFWNNGKVEYMTGFHYWYCTYWELYFGFPSFRATDMEICYFIQYCEEDPNSYGILLNTIRRYGKSSLMGGWIVYGTSSNEKWQAGMQGETDSKIKKFFRKFVIKPFFKMPNHMRPLHDTSTEQKNELNLDKPPRRGIKALAAAVGEEYLESNIEFRTSEEGAYDQEVLHRYLMEEPGKTISADVYERWGKVKPCLKRGIKVIRGMAILGTTVDNMNSQNKGGKAYKNMFHDSDVDNRGEDGRTITGLYMCYVPGDSALEDALDEWGYPDRDENRSSILMERRSLRHSPSKYAMHVRQYSLTVKEIFYVSAEHCEFNVTILQDRQHEIDLKKGIAQRGDFLEVDGRDSRIYWKSNPDNGKSLITWLPDKDKETNLIKEIGVHHEDNRIKLYEPLNNQKIRIGHDPIQHGVVDMSKRSTPVLHVKRLYDASVDGIMDNDLMIQRAADKYKYETGTYVCQFDHRFREPNEVFEYVLRICRFYGASLHVEKQKAAIINYFHQRGYGAFIMTKIQSQAEKAKHFSDLTEGTAASQPIIQQYTSLMNTYIEYFGHTIPFPELIDDLLVFDPFKTKIHDYSVSMGFTELACLKKVDVTPDLINLEDIMSIFGNEGNVSTIM